MKTKAILTFDLEFWHNSKFLRRYTPDETALADSIGHYAESIKKIMKLLDANQHKATFFVLGKFAEKYSLLTAQIAQAGHEIACHGHSHIALDKLNQLSFEKEISQSKEIIAKITGKETFGFRAPNFSLTEQTAWADEILEKNFLYDSSSSLFSPTKESCKILKIPPAFGGFYFRLLPLRIFIPLLKYLSRQHIPVLYFHPYELFDSSPKIQTGPWLKRKIKYVGTKNAWHKFQKLSEFFDFISIKQYLDENLADQSAN